VDLTISRQRNWLQETLGTAEAQPLLGPTKAATNPSCGQRRMSLTGVGVGDVDGAARGGAEEDADDALAGVAVVVVDDAEQHQRVHDHPLQRPPRQLRSLHHVHLLLLLAGNLTRTDLRRAASSLQWLRLSPVRFLCFFLAEAESQTRF
jgi:hypothetical protein